MEKKPTWKSTAFLLMMANILATLFAAIQQYIPPQTAAIISAGLTAVFTGFNAWIKVNTPPVPVAPNTPALVEVKRPEIPHWGPLI